MSTQPLRTDGMLVVGGVSHDLDFVRLELLGMLAKWPWLRTSAVVDFEQASTLAANHYLVSYTCDVRPSAAAEAALERFVTDGGRWFALHATNAWLAWTPEGVASEHRRSPFFTTLGSAFVAHPPMGVFEVEVRAPNSPLLAGIHNFTVDDEELYLSEFLSEPDEVLLATRFSGDTPGFVVDHWPEQAWHPIMYRRRVGQGEVLYLALGHARGHWDAPHRTPYYPRVERGAWTTPEFRELLRRGLAWAARLEEERNGT